MSWKEYDQFVEERIASEQKECGLLKAQLSVLLIKNLVTEQNSLSEIQQILLKRYDVEYDLLDIEDELIVLRYESTIEHEEDFYEGF